MRLLRTLLAYIAAVAMPVAAQVPQTLSPVQPGLPASATRAVATPATAPVLSQADVDTWLDGFMPYALATGDIAGAVVAVVKDGRVLTQRGFGFADVAARRQVVPDTTLFRPGSTSKLFTWTAVMQQVEAGKIDLDRDVNDYLDFKIAPAFGKPMTMRHLMTHTARFEETAKYLILFDASRSRPLGEVLRRFVPRRVHAPGTVAAYSNYGASLAGYIVERVSGQPFAAYVQRNIFRPIGMTRSTFAQPLPPGLARDFAKGYDRASQPSHPFEIIDMAPAGSMSSTGADMAKFMIAYLGGGAPLLSPAAARLIVAPANTPVPGLPAMALGFYHEDRNGRRIVGHGGDTNYFHSDLHLYLDDGVGVFVSMNSGGKEGAAQKLREQLFTQFTDRYFPFRQRALPTTSTAKAHGLAMAGNYVSTRGSDSTFLRFVALLGQASIAVNDDDTITVNALTDAGGTPKRWREVGPWQWVDASGSDRLHAVVKDGRVTLFATAGIAPIIGFVPAPASFNAAWIIPLALVALMVALLTALAWPVMALTRRSHGYQVPTAGRARLLRRASRATAWLLVIITTGWMMILAALSSDVASFDGRLDGWMRVLHVLLVVAILGTGLAIWHAVSVARTPGRRMATVWAVLFAVSAAFLVWLAISAGLLTISLDY